MTMHARLHIRPSTHDRQVQQDLAGPLASPRDLLAVEIDAQISSGFMNPLQIIVGEQTTSFGPTRTEMFPSFAAANPFAYTRRPISQISSLIRRSVTPLFH